MEDTLCSYVLLNSIGILCKILLTQVHSLLWYYMYGAFMYIFMYVIFVTR